MEITRLQEAGLLVVVIAGQAAASTSSKGSFDRMATPLKALLTVHGDVVAERLERLAREGVVDTFDFLQADDVGCALVEPGQQVSSRCLIELTFQVAMRMHGSDGQT